MSHMKRVRSSHTESCPYGHLSVLCVLFLLHEHVEGSIYGFEVEDFEITKVAKMSEISKVAEMAKMTERIQGI
jgi:hypothetical protein